MMKKDMMKKIISACLAANVKTEIKRNSKTKDLKIFFNNDPLSLFSN
jgi:hypothetical protein